MKITQIANRSWLIPITDLLSLIIEQVGEKTYRFMLLEVLFTEKKVLFATEPKPNLKKSINDVFDFTYLLLNKDNRVFEYEELEEVRENTLEYFGENHPDKLGNELSLSEKLLLRASNTFNTKTSIHQLNYWKRRLIMINGIRILIYSY